MGTHEPFREEWTILALGVEGKQEEIPHCGASAPRCTAVAGPRRASRDVDVVVTGNLLPRRNVPPCDQEGPFALV